ncbi:hypothetical protein MIT9_P2065 [Methylomarinovum caldicuralii]|uniref:Uncharacterized protein n=1 Tax=Methylomarinovum caldicuralii TaxID=438856 RepID=A0AAU9C5S5_9GAMM|nr:hypothetical protein [Methylomarinovum caldicuralii]BCX82479.1 hypothetical protein MIT9_P2065 [Methylomarinovum caldicuralii]
MQNLIRFNFYLAVLVSVVGGIAVLFKPSLVFPQLLQSYGPLARNLLLIVFYLVVIQLIMWAFRYRHSGYLEALFMGCLMLMAAVGIPFYSEINGLPRSPVLVGALTYCGISHLIYFIYAYLYCRDPEADSNCKEV